MPYGKGRLPPPPTQPPLAGTGLAGLAPQPPRPRRPGDPYNPLEEQQLAYMQAFAGSHPDVASQIAPLFFGTIEEAQQRVATNRATRMEGLSQLRQMAMELAAGTASEQAVAAAITGQADLLPGVNPEGRAMQGLEGFVSGLYDEGPVSGLAPFDARQQVAGTALDQEDRAGIGQQVIQGLEQGIPFREIRENVRRGAIASGYDEFSQSEAMNEAELAYERLIGTSLEEMRSFGDELRGEFGSGEGQLTPGGLADVTGMQDDQFAGLIGTGEGEGGRTSVESFLAALANDPAMFQQVMSNFQGSEQSPTSFAQPGASGPVNSFRLPGIPQRRY